MRKLLLFVLFLLFPATGRSQAPSTPPGTVFGTISSTECVVLGLGSVQGALRVGVTGTWTGSLHFQISVDLLNWSDDDFISLPVVAPAAASAVTSTTTS